MGFPTRPGNRSPGFYAREPLGGLRYNPGMDPPAAGRRPDPPSATRERLAGAIERVTFHSEESGFCVLRVQVKGHPDLVTVVGSAASVTPGEYIEGISD
jgi:hypothetical protein